MYYCLFYNFFVLCAHRYLENKVFVSLANGDITVYSRDQSKNKNKK